MVSGCERLPHFTIKNYQSKYLLYFKMQYKISKTGNRLIPEAKIERDKE
jgi:hypothetical protein